ncbi:hypothetical protein L1987_05962 [Smallanthus sonchifolius]|uniref:Uncharacterized protein n=1 Tax=Smallanthus sonchifolius TaxID=185202 RepID=A0ACB9JWS0_9ASTR|nr:hypothetical protein L1987_05962 [Smallanthus sonchifolius]
MFSTPVEEVPEPSSEPERDLHRRLRARSRFVARLLEFDEVVVDEVEEMANEDAGRTLSDFGKPTLEGLESSINRPTVGAHQFEIKSSIIQMVQNKWQFDGKDHEDPNTHLASFLEICATFKIRDATDDAIRLRLFPFSLRDIAKACLLSLPPRILSFQQDDGETIYEAWERFKELMRKVPHHGLLKWQQCETFYNGLEMTGKQMIDAYAGGDIGTKTPQEAYDLLEKVASKSYTQHTSRARTQRQGVHQVDVITALAAQVEVLSTKIDQMHVHKAQSLCSSSGPPPAPEGKSSLEDMVARLLANSESQTQLAEKQNHYMEERFHTHETELRNQKASIQTIENQVGQIAKLLFERPPGGLPSNTEPNPKAHVKAITLRSGRGTGPDPQHITPSRACERLVPYPGRLKKQKMEEQYGKFLGLFKQFHINLPFVEALAQMPKYARFLKDILMNKRKLEELSQVTLNEECSAVIQNKLPEKRRDPGSFTIPCLIVDFVILDMDEDKNVPIILGRPFLATAKALIDVYSGRLTLRVDEDEVTFDVGRSMQHTQNQDDSLYFVEAIYSCVRDHLHDTAEEKSLDCRRGDI